MKYQVNELEVWNAFILYFSCLKALIFGYELKEHFFFLKIEMDYD